MGSGSVRKSTGRKTSRFFFPSATPPATGATSWSANRSKTNELRTLLNRDYVAIKVDREERPDVDRVYMTFVQATTGSGGWPMSVWLTPERQPFFGGTYFPPENRWGHPGFESMLTQIATAWRTGRDQIVESAGDAVLQLQQHVRIESAAARPGPGAPWRELRTARSWTAASTFFAARSIPRWAASAARRSFRGPRSSSFCCAIMRAPGTARRWI